MADRRFNEEEVAAIFAKATEVQQARQKQFPSSSEGMTLAELQDIGREVGIAPELVSQAALSMQRTGSVTGQTFLGLPVAVGRTVELERKLSDDEWERLVVDLRETFDAKGVVRQEGSSRQWRNGNLQVWIEPTATAQRLRFKTMHANARGFMIAGLGILGVTVAGLIAKIAGGGVDQNMAGLAGPALMGIGLLAAGAVRLPGWARLRRRQMDEIASRAAVNPGG